MKKQVGSFYVILSAILFGTMPLLAKVAYAHGSNAYTVAFGRFFIGSIILGVVIYLLPGCKIKIDRRQFMELFRLSVSYALMPVLLYGSYNYMDSGMATTLHFTYPVMVMFIMVVFCRQKMEKKQIICAALCLSGVVFLSSSNSRLSLLGILLAVGSGVVYAVYIVLLGRSEVKELHPLTLAFWMALFSAVEIGAAALVTKNLVFGLDQTGWAAEIGMALFTTVFALALFQRGLFLCGEVRASLLSTFEPLTGIVIGVIVFQEVLSYQEILGIISILIAALLLVVQPGKDVKKKETN